MLSTCFETGVPKARSPNGLGRSRRVLYDALAGRGAYASVGDQAFDDDDDGPWIGRSGLPLRQAQPVRNALYNLAACAFCLSTLACRYGRLVGFRLFSSARSSHG